MPHTGQAQGRYADINGAHIYYEDEGSGHPLVLIHGWPMSARMWDEQARVLKQYYRVIRYDRRGFGRSPAEPWKDPTSVHDQADLAALLRYLNIPHAYLLGHSAGAGVATRYALDHPDQVDALILHGSGIGGFVLPEVGPFAVHDSSRILAETRGMAELRRQWLSEPINHVPANKPEVAALIDSIVAQYSGADLLLPTPPPVPGQLPTIERLRDLKMPTLIIVGGDDMEFFHINADVLAFEIAGSEKVVIPGGGHLVNMIEPERYNAEVLRFLRAVERANAKRPGQEATRSAPP
jgi:pimeloyl-ACP methyl ester carboxylesterase